MLTNKLLSGIEMAQTRADQTTPVPTIYQEFYLPATITRGSENDEVSIPPLTGFSVLATVPNGVKDAVVIDWEFQRFLSGAGWSTVATGRRIRVPTEGTRVWVDCYFDEPIIVDPEMLGDILRIKITSTTSGAIIDSNVAYQDGMVTIEGVRYPITLVKGQPTYFEGNGVGGVLYWDPASSAIRYSNRQGLGALWYGNVAGGQFTTAYQNANGTGALSGTLTWRLLTASGDNGQDFLGNSYRHSLFRHKVDAVSTLDGSAEDRYWFSKPNPSKFAIENLYFDVRDSTGGAAVIDSVLLDPITPNVYFSVYYSSEGEPARTAAEWDEKLWTRVPKTYKASRRDTYAFPQPVRARFVKVEFTFLQPRAYQPGPFQQPIRYLKHPKWVLDYFLARVNDQRITDDQFVANRVNVTFNALDLAYNYYLDDLRQSPESPMEFDSRRYRELESFILSRADTSDLIDAETLARINTIMQPYREGLALQIQNEDTLLNRFVAATISTAGREGLPAQTPLASFDVSTLDRDAVVFEQTMPVMFFYLTSRHRYREAQASFEYNRAYFVGVREVAFLRERYEKATDTTTYIEVGGDNINLSRSDFLHDNTSLVINDA